MQVVATGGLDWLAIWCQMIDAERAQAENLVGARPAQAADRWARKAHSFAQASDRNPQPDAFMRALLPHLRPTDTVLDIGAGAGRHALFLAQHVAQVVAVEPSLAMRRQLEQRLAAEDAAGVTVVPADWPAAETPHCDIAICAHVLYGVREAGPFLARMQAIARRECFVLLGFRQPSFVFSPFWEQLYGVPRLPLPGALECLNVLYQLGIPAQLTLLPASRYTFADEREALADLRWQLGLPDDPASDARVLAAMSELLERDAAGRLTPRLHPASMALLWWSSAAYT
jgi:SAM-dependent methyltransferase